jgi:hypothetical protein
MLEKSVRLPYYAADVDGVRGLSLEVFVRPEMLGSVLRLGGKFHNMENPGKTRHYLTLAHSDRRRLGYTKGHKKWRARSHLSRQLA